MILVKLHPVFPLFLWIAAARGLVEPPSNVTLQCHNLQNTLSWSYGRILPELKFKVEIFKTHGSPSVLWVNSSALSANLSEFSDPNIDYLVLVTAVIGQNESVSSKDLTYSYYMDSIVSQKCSVDLPPVDVKAHLNHTVTFHFPHPWLSYYPVKPDRPGSRKGKKRSNSEEHEFKYNVVIVGQLQHHFYCVESVCKGELPVEAQHEEHCLNITGELEKMAVKSTQLYCARPLGETSTGDNNGMADTPA